MTREEIKCGYYIAPLNIKRLYQIVKDPFTTVFIIHLRFLILRHL